MFLVVALAGARPHVTRGRAFQILIQWSVRVPSAVAVSAM